MILLPLSFIKYSVNLPNQLKIFQLFSAHLSAYLFDFSNILHYNNRRTRKDIFTDRKRAVLPMAETTQTGTIQQHSTDEVTTHRETASGKKHFSGRIKLYIASAVTLGAILLAYFMIGFHYQKVFLPATIVNETDVSGLTPEMALEQLNAHAAEYVLTIIEDGERTEQISGRDIGLYAKNDMLLQDILNNQNIITWAFQCFQGKKYSLDMEYDEQKLLSVINTLSCMDKKNWISPQDAYITYIKGDGYTIVPELPGNEILIDHFSEAVATAIDHLDHTLSLRDTGVYKTPDICSDDNALQEQFARLQPYSDMTVTYQFDSQTEILDSDTLSEWVSLDKNGNLEINEDAVAEFIKELAKKHNTAYSPKIFETSYGETVTIKHGFYGWQIDKATETENLLQVIRDGESVTREPAYLLRAASHDGADYGDTYVEINLTAQHLFYYKDGELLIESDFVSGNPSRGNATPDGAYAITYTERNATLKGQNYRTPVSYWMPFNGNVGMHDSSWRSSFGGVIYQTNGSHGCINLPPAAAKTIFENIEKGIPVLCYHLGQTEQYTNALSEEQTAAQNSPVEPQEPAASEIPADTQQPDADEMPADIQSISPTGENANNEPPAPAENETSAVIPPAPAQGTDSSQVPPVSVQSTDPVAGTSPGPTG